MQYFSFRLESTRNGDIHGEKNYDRANDENEVYRCVTEIFFNESRIGFYAILLLNQKSSCSFYVGIRFPFAFFS